MATCAGRNKFQVSHRMHAGAVPECMLFLALIDYYALFYINPSFVQHQLPGIPTGIL
jgi:hypothetical protein